MSIAIDSMVLIYAGIVPSKNNNESDAVKELSVRSKILLHEHQNDTIILPTVAIAEVLVPVPEEHMGTLAAVLSEKFVCPSFDLRASAIAATLWASHKELPRNRQYKDRHVLRADTLVISSAKSAGAKKFYSHDAKCRTLASQIMEAYDLPKRAEGDMFLRGDIESGNV